jgi:hypothetical protein
MRGGSLAFRIGLSSQHCHHPRWTTPTEEILMEAMAMSCNDFVTLIWYALEKQDRTQTESDEWTSVTQ